MVEEELIYIKPADSEEIYFTNYDEELLKKITGIRWNVWKRSYLNGWVDGKTTFLHHLILPTKQGVTVDYIDRDKRNITKENLRYLTKAANMLNRPKQKSNTSGYVGVSWNKVMNKWEASIRVEGKTKKLGFYENAKEARLVYLEAADEFTLAY
ncbi:HNH endonuclease [Thalassobacillus sp. C254]|uniref:HNH endonuclease n=1 Tax=Thalassobacillus sp. C254 TaxID=1225341 RepID=UPI0006D16440|nr:AP2 domain-containing protein [Thalassobacillus sp. C254]